MKALRTAVFDSKPHNNHRNWCRCARPGDSSLSAGCGIQRLRLSGKCAEIVSSKFGNSFLSTGCLLQRLRLAGKCLEIILKKRESQAIFSDYWSTARCPSLANTSQFQFSHTVFPFCLWCLIIGVLSSARMKKETIPKRTQSQVLQTGTNQYQFPSLKATKNTPCRNSLRVYTLSASKTFWPVA